MCIDSRISAIWTQKNKFVVACLDDFVVEFLDKDNKYDFDVV